MPSATPVFEVLRRSDRRVQLLLGRQALSLPQCRARFGHGCPLPDLTQEEEAERWIRQRPESFCHTTDPKILSQILNNYDQETHDFYRWKVRYTQAELAELIATHTKSDYGEILDLIPVERGNRDVSAG